jgi:adenylate kinase family enzyme
MPDYQKSKIYQIIPTCEHEEGDVYIGSTTRLLCERIANHRKPNNTTKADILFKKYGKENCKIELVETYPCNSREELNKREGEIIRSRMCVNYLVGQTKEERAVQRKKHYTENREKILEQKRVKYIALKSPLNYC